MCFIAFFYKTTYLNEVTALPVFEVIKSGMYNQEREEGGLSGHIKHSPKSLYYKTLRIRNIRTP